MAVTSEDLARNVEVTKTVIEKLAADLSVLPVDDGIGYMLMAVDQLDKSLPLLEDGMEDTPESRQTMATTIGAASTLGIMMTLYPELGLYTLLLLSRQVALEKKMAEKSAAEQPALEEDPTTTETA